MELKGYGVSSKATIVSNVEDISSQDTKSGTTAVVGEEGGGETQVVNAAQERGGTVIPFPTNLQSRPPTSSGLKAEAGATKTGGSNSWTSSWTESGSSETSSWSETSSSWATSSSSLHNQAR